MDPKVHAVVRGSYLACGLELGPHCNLAGARAAEIGPDGSGNKAEAAGTEVHIRVAQVGVIEYIGERALRLHFEALGDGEGLTQSG